jgi:hypothetical protein
MDKNVQQRIEIANRILRVIAAHGRRFFSQDSDQSVRMENPRVSQFEIIKGRLWFRDKYTDKLIFVHFEPRWRSRWRGFSDGGTLRSLVEHLRDFILKKVDRVNIKYFGPWAEYVCGGDLWGYGDEMGTVRGQIAALMETVNT